MDCFRADNAQTGPQRVDGEIKQVPIAKAEKQGLLLGDILVDAEDSLVVISAHTGGNNVIVVDTRACGRRKEVQKRSSRRVLLAERNNVVSRKFLANASVGVRSGRIVDGFRIASLVGKTCEVPVPFRGSRNVSGEHLPLPEPEALPTEEPECLVLDQTPTGGRPELVLGKRRRLVLDTP